MDKKVAFVTGGSRGIGREIVKTLGKEGYVVGFNYVSSESKANEFVEELKSEGVEAFSVKFDVSNFEEASNAFEEIYEKYENIDVLVNNAGITRDKLFIRMNEEDFSKVIDTNLKGVYNCTKQVARKMSKSRHGRIINLSSIAGLVGNRGQVNYSASKAGVIGFTRSLAYELAPYSITVNAIAPGFIQTDMTNAIPEKAKEALVGMIPLGDVGQPEDIAWTVAFLASDKARYITGQVISVDGGLSAI